MKILKTVWHGRRKIILTHFLCIVILFLGCTSTLIAQDQRPNIILILADDLGLGDISRFSDTYHTPNIDKIGQDGLQVSNYYAASPICSPSRAGILTGQFPAKIHFTTFLNTKADNKRKEQVDFLDPEIPSIGKLLQSAGYATGHFGKWHMGGGRDVVNAPNFDKYGFDEWSSTYESPDPDPAITATDWIWSDKDSIKRWNRTAYFVDRTLAFLKQNKGKPCYVNLWTDDVHTPWVTGDDENGRDPNNKPQSEKSFTEVLKIYDKEIGRLMQGLKDLGIDSNTIVIFTSDNGPLPNFRQDRSAGLRGSKLSLYEGGVNMPFLIRWPGHIEAGRSDETSIISAVDLLPSFCELAGVNTSGFIDLDGEDRTNVWLRGVAERTEPLIWEYGRNEFFSFPKQPNRSPILALREGKWKFLMNKDESQIELYDLSGDRNEARNVADENPNLVQHYRKVLSNWRSSLPTFVPAE